MKINVRALLGINALVTGLFGFGLMIFPEQMAQMNGFAADAGLALANRQHGAANLGLAVLSWLARDLDQGPARRAILLSFLAGYGLSLAVSVLDALDRTSSPAGWAGVLVTLALTAAFGVAVYQDR